jgi:hypothetical protein
LYTRGLEDLIVGKRKRRYFKHGSLRIGRYPPGEAPPSLRLNVIVLCMVFKMMLPLP